MTVPTTSNSVTYTGTGTVDAYDYSFRLLADTDLLVVVDDETLVLGDDYTVSGVLSYTGGKVTLLAGDLASGAALTMTRAPAEVQNTSLQSQGAYDAKVIENSLDLLTMICQWLQNQISRSAFGLPDPLALALLQWNAAGDALQNISIADLGSILAAGNYIVDTFDAGADFTPGTTTDFVLSQAPGTLNNAWVFFDGTYQQLATFTLDGDTLTFDAPVPYGVLAVEIRQAGVLPLSIPADGSVTRNTIGPFAVGTGEIDGEAVDLSKLAPEVTDLIAAEGAQVGDGKLWFASAIPAKWLACDGSSLLRASYPALFAVIGTTWGTADGTHFTLPDLRGRAPIGVGTGSYASPTPRVLADVGGLETHSLTAAENGPHTHTGLYTAAGGGGAIGFAEVAGVAALTGSSGSGTAHNIMQPFAVVNYLIRALP